MPPRRSNPLSILQVTPYPWGRGSEADIYVRRSSEGLAARGHRVTVLAPAATRTEFKRASRAAERLLERPPSLFGEPGELQVLPIGGTPTKEGSAGKRVSVPSESARLIERLLAVADADVIHVHDPYMPGLASTALRHSFALNVATFHLPEERLLSTQLARPLVQIFFGRIDLRMVSHATTGDLLNRYFPGSYELVEGGSWAAAGPSSPPPERGPLRIHYQAGEGRGALRLFLRALGRLPRDLDWWATLAIPESDRISPRLSASVRNRVLLTAATDTPDEPIADLADGGPIGHHVTCLTASTGPAVPWLLREALAAGSVPVVADLDVYAETIDEGRLGLMFPPGDPDTLAAQITRLAERGTGDDLYGALRTRIESTPALRRPWAEVAADLEEHYRSLVARRHPVERSAAIKRRLANRPLIEIDLHMHTDHSSDCATPVRVLLETARDRGLGAIAITDHNEISGALAAREVAAEMGGIEVIVGEEVKTASQGEVIGLFLEEKIPRGMTMAETVAEIRRQGGLVYVPHPFDRLHSVPDYKNLLEMVEEIDFMEVFNPRVAISAFNEEAERFARKYRIIPAAGSDSHVAQGLGSVRIRLPRFDGPAEFKEAMRDAEITRRHKNLVYVQALKFLQTTGRPKAPRRELEVAAPVRGGRPRRRVKAKHE